ncbi:MAG: hypothetical protein WCA35_17250 [Kovacikia sp.]
MRSPDLGKDEKSQARDLEKTKKLIIPSHAKQNAGQRFISQLAMNRDAFRRWRLAQHDRIHSLEFFLGEGSVRHRLAGHAF